MSEIANEAHLIKLSSKRCNTYLLQNGKYNIMIDSGSLSDRDELLRSFQKHNIRNIDALILTHAHFDHAQNAALIRETAGAKVLIHISEKEYLEKGDCPLPQGTIPVLRYVMKHHAWRSQHHFRYQACKADITFKDKFILDEFGIQGTVMHTPGHTKGSCSIILNNQTAIVGDSLMGVVPWTVFPPFADDVPMLLKSWKTLLETDCHTFYPGHGKPVSRTFLEKIYLKKTSASQANHQPAGG